MKILYLFLFSIIFISSKASYANDEYKNCIKHQILQKMVIYDIESGSRNLNCVNIEAIYSASAYSAYISDLVAITRSELVVEDEDNSFFAVLYSSDVSETPDSITSNFCLPEVLIEKSKLVLTYSSEKELYPCTWEHDISSYIMRRYKARD